ncbi:unnamed protein product [Arctogadus glacialis]
METTRGPEPSGQSSLSGKPRLLESVVDKREIGIAGGGCRALWSTSGQSPCARVCVCARHFPLMPAPPRPVCVCVFPPPPCPLSAL